MIFMLTGLCYKFTKAVTQCRGRMKLCCILILPMNVSHETVTDLQSILPWSHSIAWFNKLSSHGRLFCAWHSLAPSIDCMPLSLNSILASLSMLDFLSHIPKALSTSIHGWKWIVLADLSPLTNPSDTTLVQSFRGYKNWFSSILNLILGWLTWF